ncbi:hypothetical protein T484DRAFT_1896675 [Baffinella frigidus]|nr:hypothetical protein T484DRAFT_1896675 [Cryptophyta sp. CCMP2293]
MGIAVPQVAESTSGSNLSQGSASVSPGRSAPSRRGSMTNQASGAGLMREASGAGFKGQASRAVDGSSDAISFPRPPSDASLKIVARVASIARAASFRKQGSFVQVQSNQLPFQRRESFSQRAPSLVQRSSSKGLLHMQRQQTSKGLLNLSISKTPQAARIRACDSLQEVLQARSFPIEDLQAWDVEMVADWLSREVGLPQYEEAFRENSIAGIELIDLDDSKLDVNIGVKNKLHRKKILTRAAHLLGAKPKTKGMLEIDRQIALGARDRDFDGDSSDSSLNSSLGASSKKWGLVRQASAASGGGLFARKGSTTGGAAFGAPNMGRQPSGLRRDSLGREPSFNGQTQPSLGSSLQR